MRRSGVRLPWAAPSFASYGSYGWQAIIPFLQKLRLAGHHSLPAEATDGSSSLLETFPQGRHFYPPQLSFSGGAGFDCPYGSPLSMKQLIKVVKSYGQSVACPSMAPSILHSLRSVPRLSFSGGAGFDCP